MAVTRSSSLVVPPASSTTHYWDQLTFDIEGNFKKELPGRTMEFTFDVNQTPIIGRRYLSKGVSVVGGQLSGGSSTVSSTTSELLHEPTPMQGIGLDGVIQDFSETASPRRSLSLSANDTTQLTGWKRPWLSQARARECLVNLLNTCGQRVGLPKSPSVIFSQSSELERQSSMASSTEEVSVAPQDTNNDRSNDDMTSSEKQFAVFKDFDFLEYELESQGEESVDNFNLWGVRRRSPSNLGDSEPLSHADDGHLTEFSSAHGKKLLTQHSHTEHEWWEEEGSVSPVDDGGDRLAPLGERSRDPHHHHQHHHHHHHHHHQPPSSNIHRDPPKLTLNTALAQRSASPTSMSDLSESSDGDLGDMTPCAASPSMAAMLFRPIRQPNDLEDTWRSHLLSLMAAEAPIINPTDTCTLFSTVFADCVSKFADLVSESSHYLGEGEDLVCGATPFLHQLEVACGMAHLMYVYVDSTLLSTTSLGQRFRSTFIALHEHLDTYLDKRESAMVCLDGIKSTLKLQNLGESLPELCADEQHVDLCRCLYKLHFQLFLLYDTYAKLIVNMLHAAHSTQASDHSLPLSDLRSKLVCALEQLDGATPPTTPTQSTRRNSASVRELPEGEEGECESVGGEDESVGSVGGGRAEGSSPLSSSSLGSHDLPPSTIPPASQTEAQHQLLQLVADQRWVGAIQYVRQHRLLWQRDAHITHAYHDINIILNTYCSYLADKNPGMIAVCGTETELNETSMRLSDASVAGRSALRTMEQAQSSKQPRDTILETGIMKTEC